MDGGGVGGWYSWQKEPGAAHWFFLFQIKKGTSKLTKMAILRKKGTLGNQWQSLINSRCAVQLVHYQETCVHVLCCTTGPLSRELSGELTGPVEGKGGATV